MLNSLANNLTNLWNNVMTTFTTTIYLNDKDYEAIVEGYYQPFERGTLETPEIKQSFEVERILITPNDTVGEVNLMSYQYNWLIEDFLLETIEKDYFDYLKGKEYE
jgi:hypothetical protein